MTNDTNTSVRPGFLSRVLPWALGIVFLFAALLIAGMYPPNAFALFVCGLFLLPPVRRMIAKRMKYVAPKWMSITAGVIGMSALIAVTEPTPTQPNIPPASEAAGSPVEAQQPPPAAPASEEEQLRQIVADVLKGSTNMSKPRLRKVDVVKQVAGGWGVFVEFNGDDNLSAKSRKGGIESKMAEVYIALYTSGKDVQAATVAAYFPLVDKYGNESDGVVYKTALNGAEAAKVNWSADNTTLRRSIVPGVWTATLVHPEFR